MATNRDVILSFRIKNREHFGLKLIADRLDISISELMRELIRKKLRQEKFK